MDEEYPGYRDEREKLYTFVKIFTGVRVIYSLFYIGLCMMCGLDVTEAGKSFKHSRILLLVYSSPAVRMGSGCLNAGSQGNRSWNRWSGTFEQRSVAGSGGAWSSGGSCDLYHDCRNGHAVFGGSILHLCSV